MANYIDIIACMKEILDIYQIPCTMNELYEGAQLRFPWTDGGIAMHHSTYGAAKGHVESYQFPWDEGDVTELTPIEALKNIIVYYNNKEGN